MLVTVVRWAIPTLLFLWLSADVIVPLMLGNNPFWIFRRRKLDRQARRLQDLTERAYDEHQLAETEAQLEETLRDFSHRRKVWFGADEKNTDPAHGPKKTRKAARSL